MMGLEAFTFIVLSGSLVITWHAWRETRRQRLELQRWLRNVAAADVTEVFSGAGEHGEGGPWMRVELFVDLPLPFTARPPRPGDRVLVWLDNVPA